MGHPSPTIYVGVLFVGAGFHARPFYFAACCFTLRANSVRPPHEQQKTGD